MKIVIAAIAACLAAPMMAQTTGGAPVPMPVQRQSQGNAVLPANTEVLLQMNQEVTTKGKSWEEGDTFNLSVVHDVTVGDYVIIPRGSKAVGRITWLTSKAMFGKSGKMDIEMEYVEVGGRRIALNGTYRQEGEGNTLATVGGVVFTTIGGFFITGKSAMIPQGRELMATTETDLELALSASEMGREPTQRARLAEERAVAVTPVAPAAENSPHAEVAGDGQVQDTPTEF